ncbi:hypothetical protein MASR2M66_11140 [Chloroflexota bacterium]|nr:hypothetical protein [Anaerolineales bacterium]
MKSVPFLLLIISALIVSSCNATNDVLVSETSKGTTSYEEIIRLNNCGGKAEVKQTAQRSFATTIEFTVEVKGGVKDIVEGSVSAKYGQYRQYSKSMELVAPPGTNMEFNLGWSEDVYVGNLKVDGEDSLYKVYVPLSVELSSSKDLGCNDLSEHVDETSGTASELLPGARIIYEETFDTPDLSNWENYRIKTDVKDGLLSLKGQSNWEGVISQTKPLTGNQAALIEFSYASGTEFEAELSTGLFNTASWRVWGIFERNNGYDSNISVGSQSLESNRWLGNLVSKPDHWYIAMFKVGEGDEFTIKIWDRDNPNNYIEMVQNLGSDWENKSWLFAMDIFKGELFIDRYQQVSFN